MRRVSGSIRAIIEQARGALTRSDVELETMLAQIKRTQQEAASAQAHAEIAQREAEQRAAEARRKLAEIESAREEILQRAHEEAQAEIQLAREELNRLRQEWRAVSLTREFVENEQAKLDELGGATTCAGTPTPDPSPVCDRGGVRWESVIACGSRGWDKPVR